MTRLIKLGASGILCRNSKILMVKRAKTESLPGLWCTPGGGVEAIESIEEALIREFVEETGLTIQCEPGWESAQMSDTGKSVVVFRQVVTIKLNMEAIIGDGCEAVREWSVGEIVRDQGFITNATKRALLDFLKHNEMICP